MHVLFSQVEQFLRWGVCQSNGAVCDCAQPCGDHVCYGMVKVDWAYVGALRPRLVQQASLTGRRSVRLVCWTGVWGFTPR